MSELQQPQNLENLSGAPHVDSTPSSHRGGKKRPNKKRKFRSRNSVEDDSSHSDSFSHNAFWKNYQKAVQWGNNQEVVYWRSRAVALELENTMLRQRIQRLSLNKMSTVSPHNASLVGTPNTSFDTDQGRSVKVNTPPKKKRKRKLKKHAKQLRKHQSEEVPKEDACDSQLEFEVTEEMKDFFELHMRHKMEQGEENAKLISHPINFGARGDELKLLYGEASPTIHAMETAIQLTFRRHCEKTGARLWPNIPLRL